MNSKEKTTLELVKSEEKKLTTERNDVIQQSAYGALSKMFGEDEGTPETLLLNQATRLTNVSHSYIEERENSYLAGTISEDVRKPSSDDIETVCKLALQARENIRLALDIKKEKSKAFIEIIKAMKS